MREALPGPATANGSEVLALPVPRMRAAKPAYTTRHVDLGGAARVRTRGRPRVGDLVLATVTEVGHHTRIEAPRRSAGGAVPR